MYVAIIFYCANTIAKIIIISVIVHDSYSCNVDI